MIWDVRAPKELRKIISNPFTLKMSKLSKPKTIAGEEPELYLRSSNYWSSALFSIPQSCGVWTSENVNIQPSLNGLHTALISG